MTAMTMEMRPAGRRDLATARVARTPRAQARVVRTGVRPSSGRPGTLRLTARGRMARRVLVLGLALLVVVLLAWQAVGAGAGALGVQRVEVAPGQTLSHVAVEHLPTVPVDRAVLMLQEANDLGTSQVQAGQELVIPQP